MGKGRPRAVEKGVLGQIPPTSSSGPSVSSAGLSVPPAPVYYPTEEEFRDPLEFIDKIRPEAELFGICRIVPPKSWKPPFALDLSSFTFPTKSQEIHRLQARPPPCDPDTFELEYGRFLDSQPGKRSRKKIVFEGKDLDLCRLFNGVKRYGGYDKVCKGKMWGDVYRFVQSAGKAPECSKLVLWQLYLDHLYDFEEYQRKLATQIQIPKSGKVFNEKKNREGPTLKRRKRNYGKAIKEESDQICEQCKSGLHGEVMLLCDRCDKGWHLYCLSPPMEHVPPGNWYCLDCVNSEKDRFGFVQGKQFSLEAFRRINDRIRKKWIGPGDSTRSQIEKRFWDIVEGKSGELEVIYGSDLDTSLLGSGFPRDIDPVPSSVDPQLWKEYASNPWNLNNLHKLPGSLLRVVNDNIAGVMIPWLYIGMLYSSFCWHIEDHCFYSMNYLHWGEPKCWYGVPGNKAHAFEQVMRDTLPDLFDAQPDLLFQLVTMLNPSVLLENGVPVYGVLQEPGNFVITFPRSFHGGFNFGLNCAEAVNFAPADWLPHGGFGAEQYQLYHKASILSHEELLCMVAKSGFDSKVFCYLKEELQRVFSKEKAGRELLYKSGILNSSRMPPRKNTKYMNTDEDPTCIICQQYLHLSAVVCNCRPSALVCLEHWKHICECDPRKHRLLYQYTLAELSDLIHRSAPIQITAADVEGQSCSGDSRQLISCFIMPKSLGKKVKGGNDSQAQLAEDWLRNSCNLLRVPFSNAGYASALKEAEQFLWADHEMDPVRDMANMLIQAQKWALNLRACLSKVDNWLQCHESGFGKVCLSEVDKLVNLDPPPCNEPRYFKLKGYAVNARMLNTELAEALSSSSNVTVGQLENLYFRIAELPIHLDESENLAKRLSSVKNWISNVRKCALERKIGSIEIGALHKLNKEMMELHVQLQPQDIDLLLHTIKEAETWQRHCQEMLADRPSFKELGEFLQNTDALVVKIPELELLRKYYCDAQSWICCLHAALKNFHGREDHDNIVMELFSIFEAGKTLKVRVDELKLVEVELCKSRCRGNVMKALSVEMSLESIRQIITEAALLNIESEKMCKQLYSIVTAAMSWEEKAKYVLESASSEMLDYEALIRTSDRIPVILPSLLGVQDAVSFAKTWMRRCQCFMESNDSSAASDVLLKVNDLKELVDQSNLLKVKLEAPARLQCLLNDIECWELNAASLLDDTKSLLSMPYMNTIAESEILSKFEQLHSNIESAIEIGLSFCFDFPDLPKLQHVSTTMRWILKFLSLCSCSTLPKDTDCLIEDAERLSDEFTETAWVRALVGGARWLKKALMLIPVPQSSCKCKMNDIEDVLREIQEVEVKFPIVASQLQNAIRKHKSWVEKVQNYFQSKSKGNSWSLLLELKVIGESDAFDCPEFDKVISEIDKVQNWFLKCNEILKPSAVESLSLHGNLKNVKDSLDRSLCIYRRSNGYRTSLFCVCCSNDSEHEDAFSCLTCGDRYHLSCMGPPLASAGMTNEYACPFCLCVETGIISRNEGWPLISRGRCLELKLFLELSSDKTELYVQFQERDLVNEIVKRARECKTYLSKIINQALTHVEKDFSCICDGLLIALKAVAVAGIYDHQDACNLKSALVRHSWRVRAKNLLNETSKPTIQEVQRLLKEGLATSVTMEEYFMHELLHVRFVGLQWADLAKKVASDFGALDLSEVYKVIDEGENLPIHMQKEMKLLRERSMLYCICRKPYDQRPMIACDQCDEWYHFACINLQEPPAKTFLCPACKPHDGEFVSLASVAQSSAQEEMRFIDGEPRTPPPRCNKSRRRLYWKAGHFKNRTESLLDMKILCSSSEIDHLWRKNRKKLTRSAKKRKQFESTHFFNS